MKKWLAVMAAAMLLFTFAGCAGGGNANGGNGGSASGKDVHVFYYSYSDTYISNVRAALDKKFADAGVAYQDYDANGTQNTQSEQIETAITLGAKLLVVNIVETASNDAAQNIVALASQAGVPVVFFNREVSDTIVNSYENSVFIGTDAPEAGHLQGQMIGEYLLENYDKADLNGDGEISYVLFKGQESNPEAEYRTQYAVEDANAILEKSDKPALSFYDASNNDRYHVDRGGQWSAAANEYMTTALSSYGASKNNMIELVICNNDGMAEGAISALQTAGYNTGEEGATTIPVFGVDATPAAQELIKSGKMTGTIKQDYDAMAACIAFVAENALAGGPLLEGTEPFNVDEKSAKIRIPYSIYTG